jgi:hypothetical protein
VVARLVKNFLVMSMEWCQNPDIGLPAPDAVIFLDLSQDEAEQRGGYVCVSTTCLFVFRWFVSKTCVVPHNDISNIWGCLCLIIIFVWVFCVLSLYFYSYGGERYETRELQAISLR